MSSRFCRTAVRDNQQAPVLQQTRTAAHARR